MNTKENSFAVFTTKYNITRLVYFEVTQDVGAAIAREKQIKGWLRTKKIALIDSVNPEWRDLSARLVICESVPRMILAGTSALEILRFRSG